MVELQRNKNGTITFSYDGFRLPYAFVNVERVAENSNYYCLWITKTEFHLFNIKTGKYALKINTYQDSKTFSKIEYYSNNTKTFVAYRSDREYAYILFEDGEYESSVFKYVSKEQNGIRATKGYNDRWKYYNVVQRKFKNGNNKGLLLREDEELVPLFSTNCYTIYKTDLYYRQISFDIRNHKTYYSDKIEFYEETKANYIIGKLFNRNVYALFKRNNLTIPIGYFNSKPRYEDERNVFIAKKLNFYVIIDGNKEISNCQWVEDRFVFYKKYILNKSIGERWKLYGYLDGKEICTDWDNIRYDTNHHCVVADTAKQKNQIIEERDIEEISNLLLEKSKLCFEYRSSKIDEGKDERKIETTTTSVVDSQGYNDKTCQVESCTIEIAESRKESNITIYNNLIPNIIDYIVIVNSFTISKDGYVVSTRFQDQLLVNNHICWIIKSKRGVAITKYMPCKAHKVIYYKENVNIELFNSCNMSGFISAHISVSNSEDSFYEDIARCIINRNEQNLKERKHRVPKLVSESAIKNQIDSVEVICPRFDCKKKYDSAQFYYDSIAYSMNINDEWNKPEIFNRSRFVQKGGMLAILLDTNAKINIMDNVTHYEIVGQGKDPRFHQDFGRINGMIRDNAKQLLLFSKDEEGIIRFTDQVVCYGCYIITDANCKYRPNRKIIIFKLQSLMRK